MRLITKVIPENCNIFQFGDSHEGVLLRHKDGWDQMVDMMLSNYDGINAKHNFGIDHGDIIDAIHPDDKRFDGVTVTNTITAQQDEAVLNREKIADKLIVILNGNHPQKLWKYGPITENVCTKLNVPYGTWTSRITYTKANGDVMFKQFAAHGYGSLNSTIDDPEDRENSLKRSLRKKLSRKAGDCVIQSMGHTHKLLIKGPKADLYIGDDGQKTKQHYTDIDELDISGKTYIDPYRRWYINTGSFYKIYADGVSGYAEIAGYDPLELGYAILKVRNGRPVDIDKIVLT